MEGSLRGAFFVFCGVITVAMTVSSRRPRYLRRAMHSWAHARGDKQMIVAIEPPDRDFGIAEFQQWMSSFPGPVSIVRAPEHLGCNANTRRAMELGLSANSFAVLAEEDIEVSEDVIEYFEWASERYREDETVLAVCAHVKSSTGADDEVVRAPWFSPLIWGTWADRWENLLAGPWKDYTDSWDALVRSVCHDRQLQCVYPARSRSLHYGENSTLTPKMAGGQANYFHRSALSQCYERYRGPQSYREAPVEDIVLY